MNLHDIRNLIIQGDTAGAIKALVNIVKEGAGHNQRLRNDLIILSNRFEALKHNENLGKLNSQEVVQEHTLVNEALLNLIDEMETGVPHKQQTEGLAASRQSPKPSSRSWLLILAGITAATVLIIFLLSQGDNTGKMNRPPETVINIHGYWLTNQPPLVYFIEQNGTSYTWTIPNAESGTGRIEGDNIISQVGGRAVVSYVSARFPDGRPSEIKSHDPQFSGLILYRNQ